MSWGENGLGAKREREGVDLEVWAGEDGSGENIE